MWGHSFKVEGSDDKKQWFIDENFSSKIVYWMENRLRVRNIRDHWNGKKWSDWKNQKCIF